MCSGVASACRRRSPRLADRPLSWPCLAGGLVACGVVVGVLHRPFWLAGCLLFEFTAFRCSCFFCSSFAAMTEDILQPRRVTSSAVDRAHRRAIDAHREPARPRTTAPLTLYLVREKSAATSGSTRSLKRPASYRARIRRDFTWGCRVRELGAACVIIHCDSFS